MPVQQSFHQEVGSEPAGSEAAKFRLWVKSKGLQLGPPQGLPHTLNQREGDECEDVLYLPTGTDKVSKRFVRKI